MTNPNFTGRAYPPGAALRFLEAAPHLETCTCKRLGTCSCGHDAALDEVRSMAKRLAKVTGVAEKLKKLIAERESL